MFQNRKMIQNPITYDQKNRTVGKHHSGEKQAQSAEKNGFQDFAYEQQLYSVVKLEANPKCNRKLEAVMLTNISKNSKC